jgi:Zn-dependent protease with chaperone function
MKSSIFKTRLLAFWLLLLTSAVALAPPAHAGLFGMSEQDEIAAGQEVAREAIKEYGQPLPANDPMSVRVRAIGQQFARLSTRKTIPYSYTVLANDKVLNAFAAPGGPVFVTRLLVQTTANDAELAYVLGHETGHIERKHIVKAVEKQQKVGLAVGILGAILGNGGSSNVIGTIANVGWTFISSGYSREDEREADITGTRWMSQLGYDPQAAITMLGKLGDGSGGGIAKYLASHPDPKDRQAMLRDLIQKEKLEDVARRMGGPKLWMNGSANAGRYNNSSYPTAGGSTPAYYPPAVSAAQSTPPSYYPPADNYPAATQSVLRAPLVVSNRGSYRVVMGPVEELARWSGARTSTRGNVTTMQLGDRTLEFRRYSTVARVNGRNLEMSAAADVYNGQLYAPIGVIADGLGAQAALVDNGRSVRLTLNGQSAVLNVP